MQTPFDTAATRTFRANLVKQGERVLAFNKKLVDLQLDQLQAADRITRQQLEASLDLARNAMKASADMVLDLQKQGVEALAPAEDEAAEA